MWLHVPQTLPEVSSEDLTLLSLCAGGAMLDIGAALALESLTGRRVVCVGYCERETGAAATLVARMADAGLDSAPVWDDLATLPCELWRGRVAVVSAGIPCQPWSVAGKKLGIHDPRWLWPLVERALRGVGARVLVLENVPGFLASSDGPEGGWVYPAGLQFVLGDLAEMGWDAEWVCVSAEQVGAHHRRWRVFLVAVGPDAEGVTGRLLIQPRRSLETHAESTGRRSNRPDAETDPRRSGTQRPGNSGSARRRSAGNHKAGPDATHKTANRRQRKREEARPSTESGAERRGSAGPNPRSARCQKRPRVGHDAGEQCKAAQRARGAGPRPVPVNTEDLPFFAMPPQECAAWQSGWLIGPAGEPGLRVGVHGMALVVDEARDTQLRTSGNGVVALQAAVAVHEAGRRLGIE